jgi:hypothetical protein
MDFADLRPRPEGNGVAQTDWSGCAPLDADLAFASVHNIIASLPRRQSSYRSLYFRLREAAARFQRNLRQDEFGPTRADQIAMLNQSLHHIQIVYEILSDLSVPQASIICPRLDEELRPAKNLNWGKIFDVLYDTSDYLGNLDPALIDPFLLLADSCESFIDFPARIDTNTAASLFDQEVSSKFSLCLPDHPLAIADVLEWIDRFKTLHEATLNSLRSMRGFETSDTLHFLVWELGDIWTYVTGDPVTHYSYLKDKQICRPESDAGTFILPVVDAMLPPVEIFPKDFLDGLNKRPRIFADFRNGLPSAVASALKRYVKVEVKPAHAEP